MRTLRGEDYYCQRGYGTDNVCLVGQCKLNRQTESCRYGCEDAACLAPQDWNSATCNSWCRSGNDIPEQCSEWTSPVRLVERGTCNWE